MLQGDSDGRRWENVLAIIMAAGFVLYFLWRFMGV